MFLKEATAITGGLSNPSKMPGYGYSISRDSCPVIAKKAGCTSICSKCYAKKGRYTFPKVVEALEKRYKARTCDIKWTGAMKELIAHRCKQVPYFRWHDCGDIEYVDDVLNIREIARDLPHINFWLPTKRYEIIEMFKYEDMPSNLNIRLSAHYIDKLPEFDTIIQSRAHGGCRVEHPERLKPYTISTVIDKITFPEAFICPATTGQKGCQDCRACWDKTVKHISYKIH